MDILLSCPYAGLHILDIPSRFVTIVHCYYYLTVVVTPTVTFDCVSNMVVGYVSALLFVASSLLVVVSFPIVTG